MKSLRQAIRENRRFHKYERMLRRIRLRIFDYEDQGKLDKAETNHRPNQGHLRTMVDEAGKAAGRKDVGTTDSVTLDKSRKERSHWTRPKHGKENHEKDRDTSPLKAASFRTLIARLAFKSSSEITTWTVVKRTLPRTTTATSTSKVPGSDNHADLFRHVLLVWQTIPQGFTAHLTEEPGLHDPGEGNHRRGRTRTPSGGGPSPLPCRTHLLR